MSAHSTVAKAASGLSLARRTLGGVRGGHATGFPPQADPDLGPDYSLIWTFRTNATASGRVSHWAVQSLNGAGIVRMKEPRGRAPTVAVSMPPLGRSGSNAGYHPQDRSNRRRLRRVVAFSHRGERARPRD